MDTNDLDKIIDKTFDNECDSKSLPKVCSMIRDSYGRNKIKKRVKELILKEGMTTVQSCLAQIEHELNW